MTNQKVFKDYNVQSKTIDVENGIFSAMVSLEQVDRVGDRVIASGMDLRAFRLNPCVMGFHEYSLPPVAKALSIDILPGIGIKSTFQFPPYGISPRTDEIHSLYSLGVMRACSIGFIDLESRPMPGGRGTEFIRSELLEYSLCAIPASPGSGVIAEARALTKAMTNLKSQRSIDPRSKRLDELLSLARAGRSDAEKTAGILRILTYIQQAYYNG